GVEQLIPGKYQPRKNFNKIYINKLADSVRQDGILEPLIVRPSQKINKFEIVAGECRCRAAQLAGLLSVSCRIIVSALTLSDDKYDEDNF
ncbi:ParB N-terminal domain-containing protein, partial [Escherichia coli]|nr:ParB N-terminal domain-containing protein [Escherichia coli]